jgi:pyruvate,water dikinase
MRPVVWLDQVGKQDVGLVGGKGANLGELVKADIPVPPAFIVTSEAFFHFLRQANLRPKLRRLLRDLDVNDSDRLWQVATRIQELIRSAPMPEEIAQAIREAYRALGGGPVAVRSSATAEDLPEASFAGQQCTFLNVEGEEAVLEAVRGCWASLFEARAIFYRVQQGFDHLKVGIAVPVQRMVQSDRSGVMFTVEPVKGDAGKILVEAVYGLGEAIVSGAITPDTYLVDKATLRVLDRRVVRQVKKLARNPSPAPGEEPNVWVDVPLDDQDQQKLTDAEVRHLAALGRRIEEHYGHPQDIEWAEEGGQFYIVQTRPVTTLRGDAFAEEEEGPEETAPVLLEGAPGSPGVAVGTVRVALEPREAIAKVREGDILVTVMTAPDWVPAMKRAAAIVTERGGRTCHAAIVSRELGIPLVMGVEGATERLRDGQTVTVDGLTGRVYQGRAEARLAWWAKEQERRAQASRIRTRTKIYVNLAEPELAERVARRNVDGVGLLRAEFIIAEHIGVHPRLCLEEGRAEWFIERLADGLRQFTRAFYPRPVVYRMTDFKTNEYRNLKGGERYEPQEENPMIGYRGASRYIREPEVFRLETEAIKRVRQDYNNLWVMIPFVRTPQELARVKALLEQEGLRRSPDFKLWMMAEVPANVLILDRFLDVGIDGISIGSNDLTQLVLGIDRDSSLLASEFDERDEAVMEALRLLVQGASRRGVTVSICGQAPSDYPELARRLVEWGITSVSVNPDAIDRTREVVAQAEAELASRAAPARL